MPIDLMRRAMALLPAGLAARLGALLDRLPADLLATGGTALSAFALRVLGAAIAYGSQILLARWLGVFDYGIFVVVYVWITILGQIGNLGFSSSVIRFIPEYLARGETARLRGVLRTSRLTAVAFATLIAGAGAAAVLLLPGLVATPYVVPILLGAVCLPLFCLSEVQDGIARSFAWSDLAFGPTYVWRPIAILAAMALALGFGLPASAATACLATIVGTWATAVLQLVAIGRRIDRAVDRIPPRYDLRTWMTVSLPILLSDGFYALLTSVDVVLVAHFGRPEEVAVYYAATKTLALVHFVYYAVRAATGPRFSYHFHAGDRAALEALVHVSVRWTFWPSAAVAAVVLLAGNFLLSLFGSDFSGGSGVLAILVLGILARASVGPVETLLTMAGHQGAVAAVFGAAFALNAGLSVLMIPAFGLYGAAAATSAALVAEAIMVAAVVRRRFGLSVWILKRGGKRPREVLR